MDAIVPTRTNLPHTVRIEVSSIVDDAEEGYPDRLAWHALALLDIPEEWNLTGDTGLLRIEDAIVDACDEQETGTAFVRLDEQKGTITVAFKNTTVTVFDRATFERGA